LAIPVKNEEDRIQHCINALRIQRVIQFADLTVILHLNNCTDSTRDVVLSLVDSLPFALHVLSSNLQNQHAHVGWARRLAMEYAVETTDPAGQLITTDADCVFDPDWILEIEKAFHFDIDAIAGYVTLDPAEMNMLSPAVRYFHNQELKYQTLLAELEAIHDPLPYDPWPRHSQHSGQNAAVTVQAYRKIGGLPPCPVSEDRELFKLLQAEDLRMRHAPNARVIASARTVGRAAGGMADALNARHFQDGSADKAFEPVSAFITRCKLRASARVAWYNGEFKPWVARHHLRFPKDSVFRNFGRAWSCLEDLNRRLSRSVLTCDQLSHEITKARSELKYDMA
jgi:glycosyltransferase involved in cell wall biosynthesis